MYHTRVLICPVLSDSSTVPINHSTILRWQPTRSVFSTHPLHHLVTKLQFCAVFPRFFHRVIAPVLCLGSLDPSPCSLGLSSSPDSGGCFSCALLCAVQGCMSACRTEPAANPGGPQGGAQTGRSPGGGLDGSWAARASKPNVAGHLPPRQDRFSALQNGHGDTTQETRIQPKNITNYKSAQHYNHTYNKHSVMRTIKPQNVKYRNTKPRTRPYSIQNHAMAWSLAPTCVPVAKSSVSISHGPSMEVAPLRSLIHKVLDSVQFCSQMKSLCLSFFCLIYGSETHSVELPMMWSNYMP